MPTPFRISRGKADLPAGEGLSPTMLPRRALIISKGMPLIVVETRHCNSFWEFPRMRLRQRFAQAIDLNGLNIDPADHNLGLVPKNDRVQHLTTGGRHCGPQNRTGGIKLSR